MSTILIFIAIIAGIGIFMVINNIRHKKDMFRKIEKNWGKASEREYTSEELKSISRFFERHKSTPHIDDITWNDLDMDRIFMLLNQTYSSSGEEYLYYMLRTPCYDEEQLKERNRIINLFLEKEKERKELQFFFSQLGKTRVVSINDYIYRLSSLELKSNIPHYLMAILFGAAFITAFFQPPVGIPLAIILAGINLVSYFSEKGKVDSYFVSIEYIVNLLKKTERMPKLLPEGLEQYASDIKEARSHFSGFLRNSKTVSSGNSTGALEDVIMDYVRMLFHIDLIKFNSMVKILKNRIEHLEVLLKVLGLLESCIAIGSFRVMYPIHCNPELAHEKKSYLDGKNLYHPLIEEPVANSICTENGALITGSNASGKSTFLKTVAINSILAQTIYTCTATEYKSCFYQIYSSMALSDNLMSSESYFIVEIKSLKRIVSHAEDEIPVLCFVDEVLRGTNTVERISASAQILKSLSKENILCFAATHDIELTYLLEKDYSNYHFQEEIKENDVLFNYEIYEGRAVSRNAIKLLGIIGYDESIIQKAEETAAEFVETGNWKL